MSKPAAETRSVVVERELPHPPEKIWRALTQPHLIEEWLMKNDFAPVVGHRFNLRRNPKPDLNIVVDCRVLIVEPNKTLSYKWDAMGLDSTVTWTLTPTNRGRTCAWSNRVSAPTRSRPMAGLTPGGGKALQNWSRFWRGKIDVALTADVTTEEDQ